MNKITFHGPSVGFLDGRYLRLDAANDPITGDLLLLPTSDSTSVFQVQQADTTTVFNVDTVNARVGIGTATPTLGVLEVVGNVAIGGSNNELRFYEGVNYVGFEAPALTGNQIWVLPDADGNNGEVLKTDASGNLTWIDHGGLAGLADDDHSQYIFNAPTASARNVIQPTGAAIIPLIVKGAASQSANLQEWQDSNGLVGSAMNEDGNLELPTTTDTIGQIFQNGSRLIHTFGTSGLFVGKNAGNFTYTGTHNVGIGEEALVALTSGTYNVGVGFWAGRAITEGQGNTCIGRRAGNSITTGDRNVCIGQQAGWNITTAEENFCLGSSAGGDLTTGSYNVAIGASSLRVLISGIANIGIGSSALRSTTGESNIGIGASAGRLIVGTSENVAIGREAMRDAAGASESVAIGHQAGYNVAGQGSVFIGYQAGFNEAAGQKLYISNSNTATPLIYGEFDGAGNVGIKIHSPATTAVGLTVKGAASQSANLQEWRNSSDTVMSFIDKDGDGVFGEATQQTNAGFLQIGGYITFKESGVPTADTNYAKLWADSNNELWFQSGAGANHLLHGDAFSEIWFHGSTTGSMTVEVTISAQNALALINSFTVVGHEDDLLNVVGSASTNNLTLSAIGGGEYEISFHGSVTATGGADKVMLICLGITLATPKDITDVTDDTVSPIVITSIAHGLENGDMVEIVGVLGNDAANGSFIVSSKANDTFEIIDLSGGATTGDGDFNQGSPTGDVTILYPGNMIIHKAVRGADLGALSATGLHILANSDKLALYVANLSGTTNLTVSAVSLDAARIGD